MATVKTLRVTPAHQHSVHNAHTHELASPSSYPHFSSSPSPSHLHLHQPSRIVTQSSNTQPPTKRKVSKRVALWDTINQRKISGFASPIEKNLVKYLQGHPHCILYSTYLQKKNKEEQRRLRREAKQQGIMMQGADSDSSDDDSDIDRDEDAISEEDSADVKSSSSSNSSVGSGSEDEVKDADVSLPNSHSHSSMHQHSDADDNESMKIDSPGLYHTPQPHNAHWYTARDTTSSNSTHVGSLPSLLPPHGCIPVYPPSAFSASLASISGLSAPGHLFSPQPEPLPFESFLQRSLSQTALTDAEQVLAEVSNQHQQNPSSTAPAYLQMQQRLAPISPPSPVSPLEPVSAISYPSSGDENDGKHRTSMQRARSAIMDAASENNVSSPTLSPLASSPLPSPTSTSGYQSSVSYAPMVTPSLSPFTSMYVNTNEELMQFASTDIISSLLSPVNMNHE